jgi:putative tricarboxylic transport membrane protein
MSALADLLFGFSVALTPENLLVMAVGVFVGTIIGVLPGLGGTSGVAILMPLTFTMAPASAIIFLSSIYWGALFGGAITSILFNIPGEPWSVATTFDGYPMARQGRAGEALATAFMASFLGSLLAIILFTFFAPPLAEFALRFGPPENFAVMLLAFSTFAGLGGGSVAKTIIATAIGFLLAAVGMDIVTGRPRLHFGSVSLMSGFSFVTATIGLFGIGEILLAAEETLEYRGIQARIRLRHVWRILRDLVRHAATLISGSIVGFWIGVLPGTGATPASFISYGMAKQYSRHPERFGTGEPAGVIATECAAHAAGIGALLPLVTLGIPGSPTAAVMLGASSCGGCSPALCSSRSRRISSGG